MFNSSRVYLTSAIVSPKSCCPMLGCPISCNSRQTIVFLLSSVLVLIQNTKKPQQYPKWMKIHGEQALVLKRRPKIITIRPTHPTFSLEVVFICIILPDFTRLLTETSPYTSRNTNTMWILSTWFLFHLIEVEKYFISTWIKRSRQKTEAGHWNFDSPVLLTLWAFCLS